MTEKKAGAAPYTKKEATRWLAWLADGMERHGEEIFLIENLQPTWIESKGKRLSYVVLSRFIAGPIFLPIVMGCWGFARSKNIIQPGNIAGDAVCKSLEVCALDSGLIAGLLFGVVAGLLAVFIDVARAGIPAVSRLARAIPRKLRIVLDVALVTLFLTALQYLLDSFQGLAVPEWDGIKFGLFFGLIWAVRDARPGFAEDVRLVERLTWSWSAARHAVMRGLLWGTAAAIALAYPVTRAVGFEGKAASPIPDELMTFLGLEALVLGFVLIFGFFLGLRPTLIETKTLPNQGILLSARNSVIGALIVGAVAALVGVFVGLQDGTEAAIVLGLLFGVYSGLIGAAWFGGLDVLRHYVLRAILRQQGHLPSDLVPFLSFAADKLRFLQRVGGGYIFVHRYLLLHFAQLHGIDDESNLQG